MNDVGGLRTNRFAKLPRGQQVPLSMHRNFVGGDAGLTSPFSQRGSFLCENVILMTARAKLPCKQECLYLTTPESSLGINVKDGKSIVPHLSAIPTAWHI